MVVKADTPGQVQAMCTVRGRQRVWQRLSQHGTESKSQMLGVQMRDLNDESKTTAATDQHDVHQTDPRYAGRLDDKQGSDTIVTMESVGEAIAFNDDSTWLWLTSEQM